MNRVKLRFADLEIEFTDRDRGIRQIYEWVERGIRFPLVVFGPEGCGKTAWLKQSVEVLRGLGFEVIYIDPLRKDYIAHTSVESIIRKLAEAAAEAIGIAQIKLATLSIDLVKELISVWNKKRIAILIDDVFQAIGLDKAEIYVKGLLGLIEYPPVNYEKLIAIVATSEGVTRWRIGRHRWANLMPMWNMPKKGFEELYEKIPSPKPLFEEVWELTSGNPGMLSQLYQAKWDLNVIVKNMIEDKKLTPIFINKWRSWLEKAIEDPDVLWDPNVPEDLINELEVKNLIVYFIRDRDLELWIDIPPPERDLELGIGKRVAWQTPLHREAVKRALTEI
jgi:hypothetical protein